MKNSISVHQLFRLSHHTALALILVCSASADTVPSHSHSAAASTSVSPAAQEGPLPRRARPGLPPLPKGVAELKFGDFFVLPAGPRGLEISEKLRGLDGQRIRILGYMVRQEQAPPGRLLLTSMPAEIHEHDSGLADDLPPGTVFVSVPTMLQDPVPHTRGLMLLTGTLSVGNRPEPDGRVSVVRLALDPPRSKWGAKTKLSPPVGKGAERLASGANRIRSTAP